MGNGPMASQSCRPAVATPPGGGDAAACQGGVMARATLPAANAGPGPAEAATGTEAGPAAGIAVLAGTAAGTALFPESRGGAGALPAPLPAELEAALARARLEVDLDVVAANVAAVRRFLRPGTRLMAVVKGDAYGFGMEMAARTFVAAGADWLGTATLDAALRLRRAGITAPLLVFQPPEPGHIPYWLREGLVVVAHDLQTVEAVARAAAAQGWHPPGRPGHGGREPCPVHLEVDLGFGRGGLRPEEVAPLLAEARRWPGARIEGLFTQLPAAARPRVALRQLDRFLRLVDELAAAGLRPPLVHCAESHLLVRAPEAQLDMVRVGNLLYGFAPRAARQAGLAVRNPGRLVVRVASVHRAGPVAPGYRGDWCRPGAEIAVLPVGLADGLRPVREARFWTDRMVLAARRALAALGLGAATGGPRLRIGTRELPLRGEFMMNHCLFDATGLGLVPGQEVELLVGRLTASAHLPVVYLQGGRPVAIAWPGRQFLHLPVQGSAGPGPAGHG
mgnify:CR=1 FL=1